MNIIALGHVELRGHKAVLQGRVHLDRIPSFPAHIQVVDCLILEWGRAGDDAEHVATVLEDSPCLSRSYGEGKVKAISLA